MLCRLLALAAVAALCTPAQVYSPRVLLKGQPDASDLGRLAAGIYAQAGAHTPRERAEAVWRFFLTDGRFVKPGFWYHIAGWAYEEPSGEVLDPLNLLNSYGFGLCYQIAPVLEAVWKAGGFDDARVWFLTGHTVAEVFYDGAYHYFDSDMTGYNSVGRGPVKQLPVASVHQIETDGAIILGKLKGPKQADPAAVDDPWYPADVRAGAIGELAGLFTTTADNHLFPFARGPQSHRMDFQLRPGERLIRYFEPEREDLFYLPYQFDGTRWREFPREIARYHIRTADGPRSQKDARRWATGRIEYNPAVAAGLSQVYEVCSPYVIIDAHFDLDVALASRRHSLTVETSTDGGRTWLAAAILVGPHRGVWRAGPAVLTTSDHGRRTAVTGSYGYLVRVRSRGAEVRDALLVTQFQLNPRTLPGLSAGRNELLYHAGPARIRRELAIDPAAVRDIAYAVSNARYIGDHGQGYWTAALEGPAEFVFRLADSAGPLSGADVGARFLDLSRGLAPDKLTAEVRAVGRLRPAQAAASIAWSRLPNGPFQTIWQYDPKVRWRDGIPIDRVLAWPEVDRHIDVSGPDIYVRYRIQGMAVDSFRIAVERPGAAHSSPLEVTHVWKQDGSSRTATQQLAAGVSEQSYSIDIPAGARVSNEAIIFACRRAGAVQAELLNSRRSLPNLAAQ